jgi:hypothetical protein
MLTTPPGTEPVQESLGGRGVIVITGATGWVGRTAIRELQRLLPAPLFAERVRLFASRPGGLTLEPWPETGEVTLPVYPLSSLVELAAAGPIDAVLHTAFLTRDRLAAVGQELYVATNRWITAQVAESLVLAPAARAVVISSGAAAAYDHHAAASEHLVDDPYGVLKLEEEAILAGVANITALAWHWLMGGEVSSGLPLAAVSLSVDLLTLAQAISSLYGLPLVESAVDHQAPPNSYLADPGPFLAALAHHGITPTPLEEQLRDTAAGLQLP